MTFHRVLLFCLSLTAFHVPVHGQNTAILDAGPFAANNEDWGLLKLFYAQGNLDRAEEHFTALLTKPFTSSSNEVYELGIDISKRRLIEAIRMEDTEKQQTLMTSIFDRYDAWIAALSSNSQRSVRQCEVTAERALDWTRLQKSPSTREEAILYFEMAHECLSSNMSMKALEAYSLLLIEEFRRNKMHDALQKFGSIESTLEVILDDCHEQVDAAKKALDMTLSLELKKTVNDIESEWAELQIEVELIREQALAEKLRKEREEQERLAQEEAERKAQEQAALEALERTQAQPETAVQPTQPASSSSESPSADVNGEIVPISGGSCVLIDSDMGCFVTNAHVIHFADYGEILVNENWMKCQVLTSDADLDLAILQTNDATPFFDMRAASINEQVEHGGDITAIGYPKPDDLGYEAKITTGTVSALSFMQDPTKFQMQAPITHGSSGGGVFDAYGYLVGIASSGYRPDLDTENVNGAVKAEYIRNVLASTPCQPRYARNFSVASNRQSSAAKVFPVVAFGRAE